MTRTKPIHCGALALLLLMSAQAARAQETVKKTYPVPDHGSIQFQIPVSWKDQIRQVAGKVPPTITWTEKSGAAFRILVAVGWQDTKTGPAMNDKELKKRVEIGLAGIQTQAVEKKIEIKEIKGSSARGYYFSATDRAPKKNEFKYLTQGIVRVGDLILPFSILTNDGQHTVVLAALGAISGATRASDAPK